ncbi:hypothetical protein EDE08_103113 [Bradyrhizobium sp. R2.2-H]|uniref:hypothetical protein n=1 Tax=unclassified Bradyrhizobium TaxID=2631580 RepID=UPI00104C7CE7|nr:MULTISPECIES: hypothetical protein [unclassified Bradyrhizobium]TCU74898.1 hypothetical protein EDE10_103112 [Bradyrhizobium sp. Y-H1]TCU77666.1 hypothetical protein EDE08_103113 [Bradyrhizobium sp. R2.2-H]
MNTANKKEEKETTDVFKAADNSVKFVTSLADLAARVANAFGLVPEMRRAEYAELIDRTFATFIDQVEAVRRALREIEDECHDEKNKESKERVVEHLKRLGISSQWEKMEREMRMCAQIRSLHNRMHNFFGKRADKIANVDREKLTELIDEMIYVTEERMADYITQQLESFAQKGELVERGKLSLKSLRAELATPIAELTRAREHLMRLELKARDAIKAHENPQAA